MGKRWIALRLDENLLESLKKLEPEEENRTALIERRLKKGGRPLRL